MFVLGPSVVRGTRRDANAWRREGNQSVNNKELCSVPDVIHGLGGRAVHRCVSDS